MLLKRGVVFPAVHDMYHIYDQDADECAGRVDADITQFTASSRHKVLMYLVADSIENGQQPCNDGRIRSKALQSSKRKKEQCSEKHEDRSMRAFACNEGQ